MSALSAFPITSEEFSSTPIQESFSGPVAITVGLTNTDSEDEVALVFPPEKRYLSLVVDYQNTITWTLDVPSGVIAKFDNPGIEFLGGNPHMKVERGADGRTMTAQWNNPRNGVNAGLSFHYRLNVLIVVNGNLIPVSHDPTVHNDPPTP